MNTFNSQNRKMGHRVIIYGSRNDGESVSEEELKGLVRVLESKGFHDAYYVREAPHRLLEGIKEMARLMTR